MSRIVTLSRVRRARLALLIALLPSLLLGPGCTRRFYREKADDEVSKLLGEKTKDPRWSLQGFHVLPPAQSRFADPSNPDKPPMPPDDPAAHDLSPNPQKPYHKSGIGLIEGVGYLDMLDAWDRQNRQELEEKKTQEQKDGDPPRDERPEKLPLPKVEPTKNVIPVASSQPADKATSPAASIDAPVGADQTPSPEKMQAQAEAEARREFADVVTLSGTVPAADAKKATSKQRSFLIKLEQAVELAAINSREYQSRCEAVYLSALPVTTERFAFCTQPFAAFEVARERFGRQTPEGFANRWRADSLLGFTKLFQTGGLVVASFFNRTLWGLAGDPSSSVSQMSLDVIQPFLRGGGRAVTLEPLTQAERNLLYVIRDFARFRQEFFVYIASGQATFIPGVQAGVQALTGGTETLPGIFIPGAVPVVTPTTGPAINTQVPPGSGIQLRPVVGGSAPPQGYLSSLTDKATLVNQYRNIQSLQRFLELFRVYLEGGIVNSVQVGQVEQQLLRSVDSALSAQANYRNDLDQFKLQLGLPMDISLELDDEPLQPMFAQTRRFENVSVQFESLSNQAQQYARPSEAAQLRGRLRNLLLNSAFVKGTKFPERLRKSWAEWEKLSGQPDLEPGDNELERRLRELTKERDALTAKRDEIKEKEKGDLSRKEKDRLEVLDFEVELGRFERALRIYSRAPWDRDRESMKKLETERDALIRKRQTQKLTPQEAQRLTVLDSQLELLRRRVGLPVILFQVVFRQFLAVLEEPFAERLEAVRKQWPDLPPLCLEGTDLLRDDDDAVLAAASRAALESRLDLMNQRAQLVDSWRKIAVTANALMGTFNVTYSLDAYTPLGQLRPFQFGGSRTTHRLIFNTELPLVRILERNNYRAALISYQRQRRELQQAEDQVLFAVRLDLRQLRAAANSYHKVQKRQVELAYQQVDQSLQAFSQPQAPQGPAAPPGSVGAPPSGSGAGDPAALTQQLLTAQNALLTAQNGLYNTWINYLTTRMNLYRDLGIMPLDPRGVWIDEPARCCPPRTSEGQPKPEGAAPTALVPHPAGPGNERVRHAGGCGSAVLLLPVGCQSADGSDFAQGRTRPAPVDHHGARPVGGGGKQ